MTDGRFSGGSRGFVVGHVCPEAALRGAIAVVRDNDEIAIDATRETIELCISSPELAERLASWRPPASSGAAIASKRGGVLARYGRQATPASQGASLD